MVNNEGYMDIKVKKYIDNRFLGIGESYQLSDLKEELTTNIKEKIVDYKSQGMDDEMAFKEAVTSMGDFSSLIEDMRSFGQQAADRAIYASIAQRRTRRRVLNWLLALIYTGFIGVQLGKIQAIADFNYSLHEMLYLPANLALFTVPVLFLIYIVLVIKSLIKDGFRPLSSQSKKKAKLVIVSLIAIFFIMSYQSKTVLTAGIFLVQNKIEEDSNCYLVLNDKTIRVSRNEYNLINTGEEYLISFTSNLLFSNRGKLTSIKPIVK